VVSNYFNTIVRNLLRNKTVSAINITLLTIGIATCLAIGLLVQNELGYDRLNEKSGQRVRVIFQRSVQQQKATEANEIPPVAKNLKPIIPRVCAIMEHNVLFLEKIRLCLG
jgi:putative ABC transport system permease protein